MIASVTAFATRDFSVRIPFENITVQPYDLLTAYRVKNQNDGRSFQCVVKDALAVHPTTNISITSVNYVRNPNDSPNGLYALTGSAPAIYIKYNIQTSDANYNSYVRFYEPIPQDAYVVSCQYTS